MKDKPRLSVITDGTPHLTRVVLPDGTELGGVVRVQLDVSNGDWPRAVLTVELERRFASATMLTATGDVRPFAAHSPPTANINP